MKDRFNYVQAPQETGCPVEIQALSKSGKAGFAVLAFHEPNFALPVTLGEGLAAKIRCNGNLMMETGSSLCQSGRGLTQAISFDRPVHYSSAGNPTGCELTAKSETEYSFVSTSGLCKYSFADKKSPNLRHVLYSRGYDAITLE
jgi:hypothetical protein